MDTEEKFDLEFKERVTNSFLKTVSAFSNYNDGRIVFGINNRGKLVGIEVSDNLRLKIENMINDSIEPVPKYKFEIRELEGKSIIEVKVYKGENTPYYYKGKAFKRSDTSTVEVDRVELNRLIRQALNLNYEESKSSKEELNFTYLEQYLIKEVDLTEINLDILKTLKLYSDGHYTLAGELLSDKNDIRFSGIDIVRFGENINQILDREILTSGSLLWQYDKAIKIFERYYQYEEIKGYKRLKKELIPREAFREALANAIIHRSWDINSYIQIAMYEDRIELTSPGGLPKEITKEDYLKKNISILNNPIIAGVFYRLNLIEQFGTGIQRIIYEYKGSSTQPSFDISQNYISIVLPRLNDGQLSLVEDEKIIYNFIKKDEDVPRKKLDEKSGFNKAKTLRVINSLLAKNLIKKQGKGVNTTYSRKNNNF